MKKETVEEFLARGGVATYLPPAMPAPSSRDIIYVKPGMSLMDLDEGAHYFSEFRSVKDKKLKIIEAASIDASLIPEHLKKYLK